MNTTNIIAHPPRFTCSELSAKIDEHIKELAEATDAARMSEEMIRYLETVSKFHQYSFSNVWLILMTKPDASCVAGFHKWKTLGRFVKKGEKGIPILAPIFFPEDPVDPDSPEVLRGFRLVYVFDISQTDGTPLPEPPDWKSPKQNAVLSAKLVEFALTKGISVSVKKLAGDIQGVSKGKSIDIDPLAGTKTLIHEIAHELIHRDKDRPYDPVVRELEAESVAFIVGKHYGLEGLNSPNYIALHGADSSMILDHFERIHNTACEIIDAIGVALELK